MVHLSNDSFKGLSELPRDRGFSVPYSEGLGSKVKRANGGAMERSKVSQKVVIAVPTAWASTWRLTY